jgi:integrase/recombinase XerD
MSRADPLGCGCRHALVKGKVRTNRSITKQLFGGKEGEAARLDIIDGIILENCASVQEPVENVPIFPGNTPKSNNISLCIPKEDDFIEPTPPEDFTEPETPIKEPDPDAGPFNVPADYIIHLESAGRAKRTIQEYAWDLKWWARLYDPYAIGLHDVEKVLSKLHPSTARRKIAALRSFAKWKLREGDGKLHTVVSQVFPPKTPIRVPKDRGTEEFVDFSRCALALTKSGDRRGIWLGLMSCCGLRISEVATAIPAPGKAIKVVGKGNKERLVPAPGWLLDALEKDQDRHGKQWRKGRYLIWQELKKMGINKPHSLRHTFASELIRKGFTLEQVKLLLGHAKLDTTLVYARVALPADVTLRLGLEVEN